MRGVEWVFPLTRYARQRQEASALRAILTGLFAVVVQWFCTHVLLAFDYTVHWPLGDRALWALRKALSICWGGWRPGTEEMVFVWIFAGSLAAAVLIEFLAGRLLLCRRLPRSASRRSWKLFKFVLVGTQPWAAFWFLYTVWFMLAAHGVILVYALLIGPPSVLIVATAVQAAKATRAVCGGAGPPPTAGPS